MSSLQHSSIISMDRATQNCIKTSLKLTNSVMAMTGIAILLYSCWMLAVCFRHYHKYPLPWFFWACVGTGIIMNFIATIGHAGADTKSNFLLSLYIMFMFLLLLAEGLIIGDICLNKHWYKDFPKDHTHRFHDFVDYVDDHKSRFRCLVFFIVFSQVISFFLAMVLRTVASDSHLNYYQDEEVASATHPFINHQIQQPTPYAVGHPDPYYYPAVSAAPYSYTHGYPKVAGNDKGGYEAASSGPATPKGC